MLLIVSLCMLAACTSTKPGVTTVYYTVPGTTVEQINEQIAIRGPQDGHAIGTTETRMTPKVRTVYQDGKCRINSVDVLLELKVTLPRWADLDKADRRTRSGYTGLSRHVEEHEQRHVEISQKYAKRIEQVLLKMPPQKKCRELIADARAKFKSLFEDHNQEQRNFDAAERKEIERRLSSLGYQS
jgi:predicted secreted Zn-dependent protease